MSSSKNISKKDIKEGVVVSFKITLIFTILFVIINQNFTIRSIGYTFLISAMYSFVLGFAQIVINNLLSKKRDWINHTNLKV
jgi:hypothetical protein